MSATATPARQVTIRLTLAEAQALCTAAGSIIETGDEQDLEATFADKREIAAAHRAQGKLTAAIAQARGE